MLNDEPETRSRIDSYQVTRSVSEGESVRWLQSSSAMITVQELPDVRHPCELRHLWHSLWKRTPRATFRQAPEFIEQQSISAEQRWRMLLVSAWNRPIGIMPFIEHTERRSLGAVRILSASRSAWGHCPGPVGPHTSTTMNAAVRHLIDQDDSWDALELPEVVAASKVPHRIFNLLNSSGLTAFQQTDRQLNGFELPTTWSQFWASRDSVSRSRWRELDLLSHGGVIQLVRFRPNGAQSGETDRDWSFLNMATPLVRQQRDESLIQQADARLTELQELHASAVDEGCADIVVLLLDSAPIAYAYNVHCRSRVETLHMLADPNVSGAADLLIGHMLQDEIARGDSWHVFLPTSTAGVAADWPMWQGTQLRETLVTHYRRDDTRSRLLRWLDGSQPIRSRYLIASTPNTSL